MTNSSPPETLEAFVLEQRAEFDLALAKLEELIRFRMHVCARDGKGVLTDEVFRALTLAVTCVKDRRQQLFPGDAVCRS